MTFSPETAWLLSQLRPFIRTHFAGFALLLASTLMVLTEPLIIRFLIDEALRKRSQSLLILVIGGLLVTYLGRLVFNLWGVVLSNRATHKMIFRMRLRLLRRLQGLPAEYHEKNSVGDLLHRLENDVTVVGEITGQITTIVIRTVIGTFLIVLTMSVLNLRLTCIVLPLIPAFLLLRHRFQRPLRDSSDLVQQQKGKMTGFLQDQLACMIQVQLVCRELTEARKFTRLSAGATRSEVKRLRMELIFASLSSLIIVFSVIAILGIGSYEVLQGTLTVGSLVAFYTYALQLFAPLYAVMDIYARFQRVGASARRLLEVEQAPNSVVNNKDAVEVTGDIPTRLELSNVSFSYRSEKPVLSEISFKAEPPERIALVGASGSGKSTIARLLARLYDVGDGTVLVNGVDVRSLELKSLRSTISFVAQDAPIFDTTLLENLLYGNPKASKADLEKVANITQLKNVIGRLPGGWEEPLGPRGSKLSGGERQRVAIARALLQQPRILVLDESTSALDSATEQNLFEALGDIIEMAITIVISHRLSTIMWADRIMVVDKGKVIAEGSHSFLYASNLTYRTLCERQFELEPESQSRAPQRFSDTAVPLHRVIASTTG